MNWRARLIPLALLVAGTAPALDIFEGERSMAFSAAEVGPGYADIEGAGIITPATPDAFKAYLDDLRHRGLLDGQVSIAFNSRGGNLDAAMKLGRIIRAAGISTTVKYGGSCLSSCSYAYFGGVTRYLPIDIDALEADGQRMLGFHQFYGELDALALEEGDRSSETQRTQSSQSQITTRNLLGYLTEMGVDTEVLREASSALPEEMHYPTVRTLKQSRALSFRGETSLQVFVDESYTVAAYGRFGLTTFEQLTMGCLPGRQRRPFVALMAGRGGIRPPNQTLSRVVPLWQLPKIRAELSSEEGRRSDMIFRDSEGIERVSRIVIDNGSEKLVLPITAFDVRANRSLWVFMLYPSSEFIAKALSAKYFSANIEGVEEAGQNDRTYFIEMNRSNATSLLAVLRPCLPEKAASGL